MSKSSADWWSPLDSWERKKKRNRKPKSGSSGRRNFAFKTKDDASKRIRTDASQEE
jgi:hypothetical protein